MSVPDVAISDAGLLAELARKIGARPGELLCLRLGDCWVTKHEKLPKGQGPTGRDAREALTAALAALEGR